VNIVENYYERLGIQVEELLEKAPRIEFQSWQELRRQWRQINTLAAGTIQAGQDQVVKKCCRIRIPGVELIPQASIAAQFNPAGGESRFARPSRCADPGPPVAIPGIKLTEDPLPRKQRASVGSRELRRQC
jgi:hypothetical protein